MNLYFKIAIIYVINILKKDKKVLTNKIKAVYNKYALLMKERGVHNARLGQQNCKLRIFNILSSAAHCVSLLLGHIPASDAITAQGLFYCLQSDNLL